MATSPVTVTENKNSPGAVQALCNQIVAAARGLDSLPAFTLTGNAIARLQREIYALVKIITELVSAVNNNAGLIVSGGSVTIQEVAAPTATTTTITPSVAATAGAQLLIFVTWDSTGGGLIAFDPSLKWAVTNIDTTGGTVTCFTFVGRTVSAVTSWYMSTLPITGQIP